MQGPKYFPLPASLSSCCWPLLPCGSLPVAPREAFRVQAQSTVGKKQGKEGEQNLVAEDYLNPEIKDLQRNLVDLASAQIFSPPCFSFLSLLAAFFLLALDQQYCTTSSIQGSGPKHCRGKNKGRKKSRVWWRRWTETRAEAGVAALWKNTSAGEERRQ